MSTPRAALERAAKSVASRPGGNGFAELAELLNLSRQAVYKWLDTGVPVGRCIEIEDLTGISRVKLRPDVFSAPKKRSRAHQVAA